MDESPQNAVLFSLQHLSGKNERRNSRGCGCGAEALWPEVLPVFSETPCRQFFGLFAVLIELVCLVYINVTDGIPASRPITSTTTISGPISILISAFGIAPRPFLSPGGLLQRAVHHEQLCARATSNVASTLRSRATVVLGDSMIEGLGLATRTA